MTWALDAARRAVDTLATLSNVITPFPGGVVRSGSKVGSRYTGLKASTAEAFCPTLRGRVESKLHHEANVALEIVINGTGERAVGSAMAAAMRAAAGQGIVSDQRRQLRWQTRPLPSRLTPVTSRVEPLAATCSHLQQQVSSRHGSRAFTAHAPEPQGEQRDR